MCIRRLQNPQKHYAWGSHTEIPRFLGVQPGTRPVAEVWMGAHPTDSSRLVDGEDVGRLLCERIASDPAVSIGRAREYNGGALPFLFKMLAAETALSIQVHPSRAQAGDGFAREDAAGIPVDAPNRTYRDTNHKPELIVAAGPFWAMSGFRRYEQAHTALRGLLPEYFGEMQSQPEETRLSHILQNVLALDAAALETALTRLVPGVREIDEIPASIEHPETVYARRGDVDDEVRRAWVVELYRQYGADPGVLSPLFLNVVRLEAGQGLYQDAGLLHAYLKGFGFEIMANCDNVLRAGLTAKHIDLEELVRVVRFAAADPHLVEPVEVSDGVLEYCTPVSDFRLLKLQLRSEVVDFRPSGVPAIVLVVAGEVEATEAGVTLRRGESAFIPAACDSVGFRSSGAPASVYIATCG